MATMTLTYNLLILLIVVGSLLLLWRLKFHHEVWMVFLFGVLIVVLSLTLAFYLEADYFGKFKLLAWAVFIDFPLFLAGVAILTFKRRRILAIASAVLAACILLVGVDAFLIEPHWLEVTRLDISAPKLQRPLRVAVIADVQTDQPGEYEERVFEMVKAEEPDLILFAGDYLQLVDEERYSAELNSLNEILRRVDLDAPLGMFAIRGNVDRPQSWVKLFEGIPVTTFDTTTDVDLGPLVLTGLTLSDSGNSSLKIGGEEKFHIVLGHCPDFSLGEIDADLLLAGHTHGGQIRVPFFGPIMTLSQVPRSWASGLTTLSPGKILIVSRGIGMERVHAPRMRFNCRPELLILDLVPG
jgi:predicted MPP superfamily phosphohydrolase